MSYDVICPNMMSYDIVYIFVCLGMDGFTEYIYIYLFVLFLYIYMIIYIYTYIHTYTLYNHVYNYIYNTRNCIIIMLYYIHIVCRVVHLTDAVWNAGHDICLIEDLGHKPSRYTTGLGSQQKSSH